MQLRKFMRRVGSSLRKLGLFSSMIVSVPTNWLLMKDLNYVLKEKQANSLIKVITLMEAVLL